MEDYCAVLSESEDVPNLGIPIVLSLEGSYVCLPCGARFTHKKKFNDHMLTHEEEALCNEADSVPPAGNYIDEEVSTSAKKQYQCDICFNWYAEKRYLKTHLQLHAGQRPHRCEICNESFTHKSYLIKHIRYHQGLKPFSCETCDKRFTTRNALKMHAFNHSGLKFYVCSECKYVYLGKEAIIEHKKIHSIKQEFECDPVKDLKVPKPFSCEYCNRAFKSRNGLNMHLCVRADEKFFFCSKCKYEFQNEETLMEHRLTHMAAQRNVKCDGKELIVKNFSCDLCSKMFKNPKALRAHYSKHVAKKSHACLKCKVEFVTKKALTEHKRIHAVDKVQKYSSEKGPKGVKPFSCDICKLIYSSNSALKKHIYSHADEFSFFCYKCKCEFLDKKDFIEHTNLHTDNEGTLSVSDGFFSCYTCKKSFASRNGLKIHLFRHLSESFNICSVCHSVFLNAEDLGEHMKTHTSKKKVVYVKRETEEFVE